MKPRDWSTTASSNSTIGGINIAEGCPPGNVNDAIREMMAELATLFANLSQVNLLTNTEWLFATNANASSPTGFTNADNACFDGWRKDTTVTVYQEASTVKAGSQYAVKAASSSGSGAMAWPSSPTDSTKLNNMAGRTVAFGAWVYTNALNSTRLFVFDGTNYTYSSYHPGDSAWHWLEVSAVIPTTPTAFQAGIMPGNSVTAYMSQPMLVYSDGIGQGNYMPKGADVPAPTAAQASLFLKGNMTWAAAGMSPIGIQAFS